MDLPPPYPGTTDEKAGAYPPPAGSPSAPQQAYPPAQPAYLPTGQPGYPQPPSPGGLSTGQPGYPQPPSPGGQPPAGYGQPPPQGQYGAPPSGYAPPPGQTTVVVTSQPANIRLGEFGAITTCPHCQAQITTSTTYETGTMTWLACVGIAAIGCDAGCCFIPFCIDACKDVVHTCPNCNQIVGRYNRL